MKDDAAKLLETAINKLGLSVRAYNRVLKVGRIITDLAGTEELQSTHIVQAIKLDPRLKSVNKKDPSPTTCLVPIVRLPDPTVRRAEVQQ